MYTQGVHRVYIQGVYIGCIPRGVPRVVYIGCTMVGMLASLLYYPTMVGILASLLYTHPIPPWVYHGALLLPCVPQFMSGLWSATGRQSSGL